MSKTLQSAPGASRGKRKPASVQEQSAEDTARVKPLAVEEPGMNIFIEDAIVKVVMRGATAVKSLPGLTIVTLPALQAWRKPTQELVDETAIRRFDPVAQRLQQRAVTAILSGTAWLTSKEVGTRADPGAANKHSLASRWLNQGRIFAIEHTGQKVFPDYEFDPLGNPVPEVQQVLEILDGYSPFRVASWFESSSSQLDGRKPRELLAENPKAVIAAARTHVAGPRHG